MLRRPLWFVVTALVLCVSLSASADDDADVRLALRKAQEPLRDGKWADAAKALRAFRDAHPKTSQAAEAWVLEARALLNADDARGALAATSDFLAVNGQDAWAGRMRHTAAKAYEKLGDPGKAAALLKQLSDDSTAPQARARIGALHLELADADFDGVETQDDLGRTIKKRDVQRAFQSYQRALQVGAPPEHVNRIYERMAMIQEELGQHAAAANTWNTLLARWGLEDVKRYGAEIEPGVKRAGEAFNLTAHERWLVGRGRARVNSGQGALGRDDLTVALERFPKGKLHMEILLLLGKERLHAALSGGDNATFQEGVDWYKRAILEHRNDPKAVEAQKHLAEAYMLRGQSEQAAAEYRSLVERFPNDDFVPQARHSAAQMLLRAGAHDEAIKEWNRFLAAHPNHALWKQVRSSIVDAAFAKGAHLKEEDDVVGAIEAWRAFAETYPTDSRAPASLIRAGMALNERKDFNGAIAIWRGVLGRYAKSTVAPLAAILLAKTYEDDLHQLADAIEAYEDLIKKYPGSSEAGEARQRLERLRAKHLEVQAERVIGTEEPAVIKVTTRNIESLRVRVYRLGIEEYFLRKGTVDGVQNLQLEIVKPDWTTEWTFDDYKPFELVAADRKLPVEEAGAYVVVIGDDDLTSTTLFLVSDIECVVKRSRLRHLLVWAFDRKTQAPVEGARVLVAGSGEVGVTGKDGVWQGTKGTANGHVLVLSKVGAATTAVKLGPQVDRAGFRSKAYVYTDRPVYRPGQEVSWRAIFLAGTGGGYTNGGKHAADMKVFDARGQEVRSERVTSTAFGSFSGSFALDGAAPLGDWRVQIAVKGHGTWSGTFGVQEYRKPEFTIRVEPQQPVYLTGEKVEATLRMEYAFGGPVVDAPVRYEVYRMPRTFSASGAEDYSWYFKDDRPKPERRTSTQNAVLVLRGEARTDDGGVTRIAFDTKVQDQDAEYVVQASAQDVTRRWISDQGRIPVTRGDHMAVVKADRKVYRPKQEMKIEVRTVDARERPVARSGSVVLLRLRRSEVATDVKGPPRGRPVVVRDEEIEEASYALTTGNDGRAELKLRVPRPGRWRLRWKADGGRGTLVMAHTDVEASGEAEDPSKHARLVAARTLYREGENAELLIHSPVTGVRALLTYEGEQVLDYRILRLDGTSTLVALPVEGKHAPNVYFKIAVPGKDALLEADTEIVVLRHLDVSVNVATATAVPGEEIEVELVTRDANGNPVAAEVGLALVDETVYAVARDRADPIRPYFYDKRRVNAVMTASSLGSRFYGTTRETSKDLLADAAARQGNAKAVYAQSAIRLARESIRRGDVGQAVAQAQRAMQADPGSWDARALLSELRARPEAAKFFAFQGKDRAGVEAEKAMDALERLEGAADGMARRARPSFGDFEVDSPRKSGKPGSGGGGGRYRAPTGAVAPGMREPADKAPPAPPSADAKLDAYASKNKKGSFAGERQEGLRLLEEAHFARSAAVRNVALPDGWVGDIAARRLQEGFGLQGFGSFEVRKRFADTAGWFPAVETDENGKATVKVKLPDNLTTWRAVAHGVSKDALVGAGRGGVVARRDVLVRVDTPRFLTQTDALTIPTVVHNNTGRALDVEVRVEATGIDLSGDDETLKIGNGMRGVSDRAFAAKDPGSVEIKATALSDGGGDAVELTFPTQARGLKVQDARSGVVDTTIGALQETFLDVPENVIPGTNRLFIALYPGVEEALLDALLYLDVFPYGCVEQSVHRFLPAIQARNALRAAGSPAAEKMRQLDEAIRRGADRIRNLQNDDGSFGWFGRGQGDLAMTGYALRGLVAARANGVRGLDRSITMASNAIVQMLPKGTEDARALGHLALAESGQMQRDGYATTFRRRSDDLSVTGLAWMTMAAKRLGRGFDVEELVRVLLQRRVEKDGLTHWAGRKGDCFVGSDREATGVAVEALIRAKSASEHVERGVNWLLANQSRRGLGSTKDAAAFVGAASAYVGEGHGQGFGGTVEVLLDGKVLRTVQTAAAPMKYVDRRFEIEEADALRTGRHRLAFRLRGQGRLNWTARLESVVASETLPADEHGLRVERSYMRPEEAPIEGQPPRVKPGYTILRPAARPKVEPQELDAVASGDKVLVRLKLHASRELEYVLIEDPIPAGFEVLADTSKGRFDWQERRDNRHVFFCSKLPKGAYVLEYVLQATHLGSFTALGTTAFGMYAPEFHGRAAGRSIRVLTPDDARRPDVERPPTPDELYDRAKTLFGAKQHADARRIFESLRKEQPLRDQIIVEIEGFLLRIAIATEDAKATVRAREELVRRDPGRIPNDLDTQRAIAGAYHAIDEFEVANGLYRNLVARGFALESDWSSTLTQRGREVEGLDRLGMVLRGYPISNATARAAFARAQRYQELKRPAGRPGGEEGRPMDAETLNALWAMTAHFADTPMAAPASYALIDALRRSGNATGAAANAEAFLRRFPKSHFVDDSWYFLADSRYQTFESDPSEEAAAAVREAAEALVNQKFVHVGGAQAYSEFRGRAYHVLARMYHVLGDLDQAIAMYRKAGNLEDAREALAFLTEKRFSIDETVTAPLADGTSFTVRYRNMDEVELKAYPVDLQVLFAVRKTLVDLHKVDLSGIVPAHQWTVALKDGKDHAAHDADVVLPVKGKAPGVWLVVAKAGDHEASTVVIKTDLRVVLQRVGNKVRVYVTGADGLPVRGAYVTVSDGKSIRARGVTDGRGVFEAPGVGATPSVVVSKGDRYAIAR